MKESTQKKLLYSSIAIDAVAFVVLLIGLLMNIVKSGKGLSCIISGGGILMIGLILQLIYLGEMIMHKKQAAEQVAAPVAPVSAPTTTPAKVPAKKAPVKK